MSSVVPALAGGALGTLGHLASWLLLLAATTAFLGIATVERSHEYYRAARDHFRDLEDRLGLRREGLALRTTEGMSGQLASDEPRLRVYRLVQGLLALLMIFDVAVAISLWP